MASAAKEDIDYIQVSNTSGDDFDKLVITSGPVLDKVEKHAFQEVFIYPFIVILAFMVVGFIGNSVVLYIFSFRWKSSKTTVFILTLAILDIFNCSWNMSIEVTMLYHPLTFDFETLCKVSRYTTYVVSASYSFVLVAIGFDRYLMICRPFKSMTLGVTYAKRCCICGVIFGIITQWPSLFFYGTFVYQVPIPSEGTNFSAIYVEGKTCLVSNYYLSNKLLPYAFQTFLFIGHIVIFVLLITVYIIIGRKLFLSSRLDIGEQRKPSKMFRLSVVSAVTGVIPKGTLCSRGSKTTSVDNVNTEGNAPIDRFQNGRGRRTSLEIKPRRYERVCRKHGRRERCICSTVCDTRSLENISNPARYIHSNSQHHEAKQSLQLQGNVDRHSGSSYGSAATGSDRNSNPISAGDIAQPLIGRSHSIDPNTKFNLSSRTKRMSSDIKEASLKQNTLIMRMVTFTFILSYFPFLVIVSVRYSDRNVPRNINTVSQILYHVFLRSYFFNSVVRPFIYMFMDADYRRNIISIFTCGKFGNA